MHTTRSTQTLTPAGFAPSGKLALTNERLPTMQGLLAAALARLSFWERPPAPFMKCCLFLLAAFCLSPAQLALAQTATETESALPRLVRFGGTVKDVNGSALPGVAGITFALYANQTGGAPLWMETQNVTADSDGRYTILLGSTKSEGLPAELFTSEQAHWVGVQVQGLAEQPRVLLVSAPYALKAGDAETIGGLPPSAFVLATPSTSGPATAGARAANKAGREAAGATATDVTTTGGTANYLPMFNSSSTLCDSKL